MRTLRSAGFDNISLDLIFALPAELERGLAPRPRDGRGAPNRSICPSTGLTVEERTPLARWVSRGASSAPDDDRYADEYLLAHERLAVAGYEFYEVSNAARKGKNLPSTTPRIGPDGRTGGSGRPRTALTDGAASGTSGRGRTTGRRSKRGRARSSRKKCSPWSSGKSRRSIWVCVPGTACRQQLWGLIVVMRGSMQDGVKRWMGGFG